jgi:membrane-bound metal-dependent hydrolase YbcI (DUF457 family)
VLAGVEQFAIKPGITATNALELQYVAISHSLLMDAVWGGLLAGIYYAVRKSARGAWVIFFAVLSHWVLDWMAHRPDMPLAPGIHAVFGLGLYNSRIGMLLVEGLLWLAGIVIYERATRSRGRAGIWVFYIVVALLTWLWLGSLNGAPPPVSVATIGKIDVIAIGVLVGWAYWVDRLREPAVGAADTSPAHQAG